MDHGPRERGEARDLGDHGLCIFPTSDHQEASEVNAVLALDPPEPGRRVEFGPGHGLAEPRPDREVPGVGLHVRDELVPRRVRGEIWREIEEREPTEVSREVELEAGVGPGLPQRGEAGAPFEDEGRDVVYLEAGRHGEA